MLVEYYVVEDYYKRGDNSQVGVAVTNQTATDPADPTNQRYLTTNNIPFLCHLLHHQLIIPHFGLWNDLSQYRNGNETILAEQK